MAELPAFLQPHTATVRTRQGSTGAGELFAELRTVRCFADQKVRMVRNQVGEQVVSSTTLYTTADLSWFTPGSITDRGVVISAAPRNDGDLGGWAHVEVTLE